MATIRNEEDRLREENQRLRALIEKYHALILRLEEKYGSVSEEMPDRNG